MIECHVLILAPRDPGGEGGVAMRTQTIRKDVIPVAHAQLWVFAVGIALVCCATAGARIWYVSAGAAGTGDQWDDALGTITAALVVSASGDEVWVQSATYSESIVLQEGVALYGGFAGGETDIAQRNWVAWPTVIDAAGTGASAVTGADSARLDGFVVTGGDTVFGGGVFCSATAPTLANCTITGNTAAAFGGGVYCLSASPVLLNCTISENTAFAFGGGLFCYVASSPTLIDCTVAVNTGGGVYCVDASSPTLTRCAITGNVSEWADGGGVYCQSASSPTLTHCRIAGNLGNFGGGISVWEESSPTLIGCAILDNSALSDGGGIFSAYLSSPVLTNSTIQGNTAPFGGGLSCWSGSAPVFTNCVLVGNTAWENGGAAYSAEAEPVFTNCTMAGNAIDWGDGAGVYGWDSTVRLTNCILWNAGNELSGSAGYVCTYSDVEGGAPGIGNINTDPRFVYPWDGSVADLHLLPDSPCVDTGTYLGAPEADIEGNSRAIGGGCDMGAYEYQGADLDSDGLPDIIEHNAPAAGQTSRYLADTDRDGLLDGAEDINSNGRHDPGETNARLADSDGDRYEDALDSNPLDPSLPVLPFADVDGDALPDNVDPHAGRDADGDRFDDGYEAAWFGALEAVTDVLRHPPLGDVNGEGAVSNLDGLIIQAFFLGLIPAGSVAFDAGPHHQDGFRYADLNADAQISNLDGLIAQAFFLGLVPTLPLRL